jgi:hypothetical protein
MVGARACAQGRRRRRRKEKRNKQSRLQHTLRLLGLIAHGSPLWKLDTFSKSVALARSAGFLRLATVHASTHVHHATYGTRVRTIVPVVWLSVQHVQDRHKQRGVAQHRGTVAKVVAVVAGLLAMGLGTEEVRGHLCPTTAFARTSCQATTTRQVVGQPGRHGVPHPYHDQATPTTPTTTTAATAAATTTTTLSLFLLLLLRLVLLGAMMTTEVDGVEHGSSSRSGESKWRSGATCDGSSSNGGPSSRGSTIGGTTWGGGAAGAAGAARGGGVVRASMRHKRRARSRSGSGVLLRESLTLRDLVPNSAAQRAKASANAHAANAQEVYYTVCALEKMNEPVPLGLRQVMLDRLHAALRRSVPLFSGDNDGRDQLVNAFAAPVGAAAAAAVVACRVTMTTTTTMATTTTMMTASTVVADAVVVARQVVGAAAVAVVVASRVTMTATTTTTTTMTKTTTMVAAYAVVMARQVVAVAVAVVVAPRFMMTEVADLRPVALVEMTEVVWSLTTLVFIATE